MESNEFIAKIKADGTENDVRDIDEVYNEYKSILSTLSSRNRASFSLNVLSMLCRNIEKVPSWWSQVDGKALLTLSIDCVRETRCAEKSDRVKTLACIYHLHKHFVKKNKAIPPELVLKLSYMPFEVEISDLLSEYCKTYWNILVDRISYIDILKKEKRAIIKLLPKITDDILKIIHIYDNVQFCVNILNYLIKKLQYLYNDNYSKELCETYKKIFIEIAKTDLKAFKALKDRETLELYTKISDCLYVIAENSCKIKFRDSALDNGVRVCLSMFGHASDIFHCLQTFYLNCFACIFTNNPNPSYKETILANFPPSCETTEKLGHKKLMQATYPYLAQFLRLYIEFFISNSEQYKWQMHFTELTQLGCLITMLFLMRKLRESDQLFKCDNCSIKSGCHDAVRISFLARLFISISITQELDLTKILPSYYALIAEQYIILTELATLGCKNYDKFFQKSQSDIHNTAIALNKAKQYEYSIKLFDLYIQHEVIHFRGNNELKNISRALYNKSICEMDNCLYENALSDAYLSLIFAQNEDLSDKYMSLVMDVKAKALKSSNDDEDLQMTSVLEACIMSAKNSGYGNIKPFFQRLKFSDLLKHEFQMYIKLWPSIAPIAGVWKSLQELVQRKHVLCLSAENEDTLLETLFEVIVTTPTTVRTIHNDTYRNIVNEMLDRFEVTKPTTVEQKLIYATLLFLKCEYDIHEASERHGWKTESNVDPELAQTVRTVPQEHAALVAAMQAVKALTDIGNIAEVRDQIWRPSLRIAAVLVQELLHFQQYPHALQLAHSCCEMALKVEDRETYVKCAGALLYESGTTDARLRRVSERAGECVAVLMKNERTLDLALVCLCDIAVYYRKCGEKGSAAKLLQVVYAKILDTLTKRPDFDLARSAGRLLDACSLVRGERELDLSAHAHFLTLRTDAIEWSERRFVSVWRRRMLSAVGTRAVALARSLRLWRRARAAAACALPASAAHAQAAVLAVLAALLHTSDTSNTSDTSDRRNLAGDAQIDINHRIKYILGLQPTNETQQNCHKQYKKQCVTDKTEYKAPFTPKQELESMLDTQVFKRVQSSPTSLYTTVPAFKIPEFLLHDASCTCYACETPSCHIMACFLSGLEASKYFRSKEMEIARNYFDGVLKCFGLVEANLRSIFKRYKELGYEKYILDIAEKLYEEQFQNVQLEVLIEIAYFELCQKNYEAADNYIYVRIQELMQEMSYINLYMKIEVLNVMVASEKSRETVRKTDLTSLECEFESLKLSPKNDVLMTPISKPDKPPKIDNIVVSSEEVPYVKLTVKKLDFDSTGSDEVSMKPQKKTFKVPILMISKPSLELPTPRTVKSKSSIAVTQSQSDSNTDLNMEIATPKPNKSSKEFFTPGETPGELFFTPMTSIKTYSKKNLGQNVVKNLENEFLTPNRDKEKKASSSGILKVPKSRSRQESAKGRKNLQRATSPGKLEKEEILTRSTSRRLRKNVNFSLDGDEKL